VVERARHALGKLFGSYSPLNFLPEISQGAGNGSTIFLLLTRDTATCMASVRSMPFS